MECVRCGATAVIEGALMDTTAGGVAFLSKDISYSKQIFGSCSRKIMRTRVCNVLISDSLSRFRSDRNR